MSDAKPPGETAADYEAAGLYDPAAPNAAERLAIGFVDLVGFTPLSRERAPEDLAAVVERFEGLANDVIAAHDGRVVKLIGDAVMFVAVEPSAACEIALTMVERFAQDAVVTPRGGLAGGPVLTRGGDYYGPVVNVAARIAERAVPNEILVTRAIVDDAAGDRCRCEPAGKRMLKGFPEPVSLYGAQRP
jgi:adenylate cyclase